MRSLTLVVGLLVLVGCGAAPSGGAAGPPYGEWVSARGASHPLTGRIWAVADGAWIEPDALVQRLRQAHYVLLGEKHDNPDHHRLQAWLLDGVFAGGRHGVVAFEMLDEDDAAALAALDRPAAADVARAVDWARSGWPPFVIYKPVFDAALAAGARLVAAHPTRDTLRVAMTEGVDGWPDTRKARLGLDRPLPPEAQADLRQQIIDTHCGHAPEHIIEPMALAQRVKDGWMASRLLQATGERGGVLIAGGEHARRDRGVPWFLALQDARPSVSVAFREVADGQTDPPADAPFDYVWFTPRLDDVDPCEKFRAQLERMRKAHRAP